MRETNKTYHLFVYGSLRSGFRNPAYQYLSDFFSLQGEAVVKGRFFDKGSYPVAVPTTENHFISGELYVVRDPGCFDWAIAQLDDYEGIVVEPGETPQYRRDLVSVYQDGHTIQSWIYWYNGPVEEMKEIETGDILKYLQDKHKP